MEQPQQQGATTSQAIEACLTGLHRLLRNSLTPDSLKDYPYMAASTAELVEAFPLLLELVEALLAERLLRPAFDAIVDTELAAARENVEWCLRRLCKS